MTEKMAGANRYEVCKVVISDVDNCNYTQETIGEWRVVDLISGEIVLKFGWSIFQDNSEWPERTFYHGPKSVVLSDDETQVRLYYTMEHVCGFKFEGKDDPVQFETVAIPLKKET